MIARFLAWRKARIAAQFVDTILQPDPYNWLRGEIAMLRQDMQAMERRVTDRLDTLSPDDAVLMREFDGLELVMPGQAIRPRDCDVRDTAAAMIPTRDDEGDVE